MGLTHSAGEGKLTCFRLADKFVLKFDEQEPAYCACKRVAPKVMTSGYIAETEVSVDNSLEKSTIQGHAFKQQKSDVTSMKTLHVVS